ncbi:MAG TPA: LA2681 family HEPN domain-containing protein [Flavipsychrobacter sp.]|nr:LA2681 family HEPN domain-containing protein [Flavipsychrobacter sp.]
MKKRLVQDSLYNLLDQERFNEARELLLSVQTDKVFSDDDFIFQLNLITILIDIGRESFTESDLTKAISFYESNEKKICTFISLADYYYNLANAKQGLATIFYKENKGVHPIDIIKEKLQEPINLFWLASKHVANNDSLLHRILVNLSSSLVSIGRIVEGIQFLDLALNNNSNYPQALISRAINLEYLSEVTNCSITVALFIQIYNGYQKGIETNVLPSSIFNRSIIGRNKALDVIQRKGFDINNIAKELKETEQEFNNHTSFRKFCILNFLTLNEHSIYCNCVATEKDDLRIGVGHGMFKKEFIVKLELLLNRIKSEFAFARWVYFQSVFNIAEIDFDMKFSELFDAETINPQTEMLRSAFRICYGILDKIALGLCKLYQLDSKRIYFETFWDEPVRKEQIKSKKNIHLNALYSIACDLNKSSGELKHFKNWRNKLEHNLLVLKNRNEKSKDIFKIFEDTEFVAVADTKEFDNATLHLLQLTRAAIFSFVYCVRLETIESPNAQSNISEIKLGFK